MSRIKYMFLGLIIGAGLSYGAATNYLIRTTHGFEVVPKSSLSFGDSFVDTRGFGITDWTAHPQLVKDITVSGKHHILTGTEAPKSSTPSPSTMLQSK